MFRQVAKAHCRMSVIQSKREREREMQECRLLYSKRPEIRVYSELNLEVVNSNKIKQIQNKNLIGISWELDDEVQWK